MTKPIIHDGQAPSRRPPESEPEHRGDGELDEHPLDAPATPQTYEDRVAVEKQLELPKSDAVPPKKK